MKLEKIFLKLQKTPLMTCVERARHRSLTADTHVRGGPNSNRFTGELPQSFTNLTNLERLHIEFNALGDCRWIQEFLPEDIDLEIDEVGGCAGEVVDENGNKLTIPQRMAKGCVGCALAFVPSFRGRKCVIS